MVIYKTNVSVLNEQVDTFETTPIECTLESLDYKISAYTANRVTGNMNVIDCNICSREWSHLKGLKFHHLGPQPIVDLLIGLDCADLHYSFKDIRGKPGQPVARLTPLGWTCVGALNDAHQNGPKTHFGRTCFVSDQTVMEEVNTVLCQFWEIDNSGVESLPAMTLEEKLAMEWAERSIKFSIGHYQIAIPWKESNLLLPDNYNMAFQRLQTPERHLIKDPDVAKV